MRNEMELPEGWKKLTLKDVSEGVNAIVDGPFGSNLKTSDYIDDFESGVPVLTTKNLEGNYSNEKVRFISQSKFEELKRSQVNPGDILVAKIGSIGKVGVYPKGHKTAIIPANLLKFTVSRKVNFNYVLYYLKSQGLQNKIKDIATATAQPAFNVTKFRLLPIPIPEKDIQDQIVQKIEELFSELDKGIENFKTAQQQLKVYRQAVLKWAFEGKLTNDNVKDGELPEGWNMESLSGFIEKPKYGTSKKCDYNIIGKGVIRIPNIKIGLIDKSDLKYAEFSTDEVDTYSLKNGDLLIIRSNGSVDIVGQCALIREVDEDLLFAGYLILLRPLRDKIIPQFLRYILTSSNLRNQIEEKAKSTSGVNNINAEELKGLLITICTVVEQAKVVQEIESRLSVCDKMEETITTSLQQAEALRQSILKKAFEGKLVNQNVKILEFDQIDSYE